MVNIIVSNFIGGNAISMASGNKINKIIVDNWNCSGKITIDFIGVEVFASPFFNACIGVLLKERKINELQEKLTFNNISPHGRKLLNLVISNAIKFYENSSATNSGLDDIKGEL